MSIVIKCLAIAICLLLQSGCTLLKPVKLPDVQCYRISQGSLHPTQGQASNMILLVSTPTVTQGFNSTGMMYSTHAYETKAFADNRWLAEPGQMLLPLLVKSLENTHHYRAVVTRPYTGRIDRCLDTRLWLLQQEFHGHNSIEHIQCQVQLIDMVNQNIIAEHQFDLSAPAPSPNPYGGVVAANHVVSRMLDEITNMANH